MGTHSERFRSCQLRELRESILSNLSEIVACNTVILYGQAAGSELARQFLLESGVSQVLELRFPETQAKCITDLFQSQNDGLLHPPKSMRRYLDKIDPSREAKVYGGSSISAKTVDGREVIGGRLPVWRELEKKKHQSELTSGQDDYNPYYIDFLNGVQLGDLFDCCMQNRPCILSGDSKGRVAMGSDFVYLVQRDMPVKLIKKICAMLYRRCDGIRVARFNEGVPATYYGFVSDEQYVLYGPVEALVGFDCNDYKVVAPGILIPVALPDLLIKRAREDVLIVVRRLVDRAGYRGAFGVDGCFRQNCFVVHEINTRICAGFSLMSRWYRNLIPFGLIDMIIREGKSEKSKSLLDILRHDADKVCLSVDLKLWEDHKLEESLRDKIPLSNEANDLDKWKSLVRSEALQKSTPFYGMIIE